MFSPAILSTALALELWLLAKAPGLESDEFLRRQDEHSTISRAVEEAGPTTVEVLGARALNPQVYLAHLGSMARAEPTEENARRIQAMISSFLLDAGYELATVTVQLLGETIQVEIDEGRLEKILFPGESALDVVQLRSGLRIPEGVFNRPDLETQLLELEEEKNIRVDRYELVPRDASRVVRPRIQEFEFFEATTIIPPQGRYELHIYVEHLRPARGLDFAARVESPDGVVLNGTYGFKGLAHAGDRWTVRADLGLRLLDVFGSQDETDRRFFSRAGIGGEYATPFLAGSRFRLIVAPGVAYLNRERLDLSIRSYDLAVFDLAVLVAAGLADTFEIGVGTGFQYRWLIGVDQTEPIQRVDPAQTPRPYLLLSVEAEIGKSLRRDLRHELGARLQYLPSPSYNSLLLLAFGYEKTFGWDWDDILVETELAAVLGDLAFTDAVDLGDFLRGVYGSSIYVDKAVSAGAEYRFSLIRDRLKAGPFAQAVLYEAARANAGAGGVSSSFGLGFHALVLDTFNLSFYVAGGVSTDLEPTYGLSFSLSQVY